MELAAFEQELFLKGWVKVEEGEYELHPQGGYLSFFLHYHREVDQWKLKRFGLGLNITSFNQLNERTLEAIFSLCSQYAKLADY